MSDFSGALPPSVNTEKCMENFYGILPAVVTPFDDGGNFMPGAFERLLECLYGAGVHGIYVCGQTGEGLLQPPSQRKAVAECAVRCSPAGKQVIVHVGAARTSDAVDLARHAAHIGAHAISSLPPAGGYSFTELKSYYTELAAASDLPLLVYYFPQVSTAIQTADQILELCAIPSVIGLKFTDFDLFRLATVKQHGAIVFSGRDEVLVPGLLMGADGGIGSFYNLVPELFLQVYTRARAGDWEGARSVQLRINELIRISLRFPVYAAIKAMLEWSGTDCGRVLPPRRSLTAAEKAELHGLLAASSFAGAPLAGVAIV